MPLSRKMFVTVALAVVAPMTMNIAATPAFAMKSECMLKAEEEANKAGEPGSPEWYAAYDWTYEYCRVGVTQCDDGVCYIPGV